MDVKYYSKNASTDAPMSVEDSFKRLNRAEQEAFCSLTSEEIKYLTKECFIEEYVAYLRKGKTGEKLGSDFQILSIKGTPVQLTKFKAVLLMVLADYQGSTTFFPSDFSLEDKEALDELRIYPGVAIIKIPKGASTSEGLDTHRAEIIHSVLSTRRELFNPSVILMEENIQGKLSTTKDLIHVIKLDNDRLKSDYNNGESMFKDESASRHKPEYVPSHNVSSNTSSYNSTYSSSYNKKSKNPSASLLDRRQGI